MIRAAILGLLVVAPACSSATSDPPVVAASAKAGVVVEVAGKVTATRAGVTRDLATGADVSSDDVVATAADAKVTIELAHNHARWSLGAGRQGKVSESPAWQLPVAAVAAAAVEGDMSAAGRHSEHSAIDTAASTTVVPRTPEPTTPPGGSAPATGSAAPPKDSGGGGKGEGTIGLGHIGTIGHGAGTGTGQGYGAGGGQLGGSHAKPPTITPGSTTVNGAVSSEVIQRIVRQNFGKIRLCYETALKRDPTLSGRVEVKFVIGTDGAVPTAIATGVDPDLDACIAAKFKMLAFPVPDGGGIVTITYPITFAPD